MNSDKRIESDESINLVGLIDPVISRGHFLAEHGGLVLLVSLDCSKMK